MGEVLVESLTFIGIGMVTADFIATRVLKSRCFFIRVKTVLISDMRAVVKTRFVSSDLNVLLIFDPKNIGKR